MIKINQPAPAFSATAYQNEEFKRVCLSDFKEKWVILFFYPADFTFVCPTELGGLADHYEEFKKLGAEILCVSCDTEFVHKAWHDNSETIKKVSFPMIADPTRKMCRDYETLIEDEGLSFRATFIIDPDGVLKSMEMNANNVGRSTKELLRKMKALQFVRKNNGQVCPIDWEDGEKTLTNGIDQVGKI